MTMLERAIDAAASAVGADWEESARGLAMASPRGLPGRLHCSVTSKKRHVQPAVEPGRLETATRREL